MALNEGSQVRAITTGCCATGCLFSLSDLYCSDTKCVPAVKSVRGCVPCVLHSEHSHVHVHTKSCFVACFYVTVCCEPLIFLLVNDIRRCFWTRRWIPSPQCYSAMWIPEICVTELTLNPLTWKIWWANNASRWQMGFNAPCKELTMEVFAFEYTLLLCFSIIRVIHTLVACE